MRKILIIFAHPALHKSRVNKVLIEDIDRMEGITFHDLYDAYPEMDIDANIEKNLLEQNDVIVFHYPFFWYSTPAILKEWQDLVLEHGWAYGHEGNALKNKLFFNIITTGGKKEAYSKNNSQTITMRQLLAPIEQTAKLCKMIFIPPYVIHGTHSITEDKVINHKHNYHKILTLFRDNKVDLSKLSSLDYLNDYLEI